MLAATLPPECYTHALRLLYFASCEPFHYKLGSNTSAILSTCGILSCMSLMSYIQTLSNPLILDEPESAGESRALA